MRRISVLPPRGLRGWVMLGSVVLMGVALASDPTSAQFHLTGVHQKPLADLDARGAAVQPTAAQKGIVASLGAAALWNRFGTPSSLINYRGYLATGLAGAPEVAARGWIRQNRTLFRLSDQGVNDLELVNVSKLGGGGDAVLFRQTFSGLASTHDGLIAVGIRDGKVGYVSSSLTADGPLAAGTPMSAKQAWLKAAANVGRPVPAIAVTSLGADQSWTGFKVDGLSFAGRARLVAMPMPAGGARPAYETIVADFDDGEMMGYTVFVDALSGQVLARDNRVDQLAAAGAALTNQAVPFSGEYQDDPLPKMCGPEHPFDVDANTTTIDVSATAAVITNDIVIKLILPDGTELSGDTGTSPEAIHYAPPTGIEAGTYKAQVCPFNDPTAPPSEPYAYSGMIITSEVPGGTAFPYPPKWEIFKASPLLTLAPTDIRIVACWVLSGTFVTKDLSDCDTAFGKLQNLAARAPWDVLASQATFTTQGNAAVTAEAWYAANTVLFGNLGPGPTGFRPVDFNRDYLFAWENKWATDGQRCSPALLVTPGDNDVPPGATNLFAMHNRMHDWAYFLGFTEDNFNLQVENFGNTPPANQNDPEIGSTQAGAVTGGPTAAYGGRDNANQLTLNDGIPGLTNQYLFQPLPGIIYPPCVDGELDNGIVGHEYTHAISNRMVAGPDAGLSGEQAGAMGEGWSDLTAAEYLLEYDLIPVGGESPFALAPYAAGNGLVGIRNYALNNNPLRYGDYGYDVFGAEVHADGEIWNGVNWEIRQTLINKYKGSFPASDKALQRKCADGQLPVNQCPGNRRWIQIVFNAYLLTATSTPSFLDSRNAYLGADLLTFGGANQTDLWRVFARRGLGQNASTTNNDDADPIPSFESAVESNEATLTFTAEAIDEGNAPVKAEIFIGRYEARATPVADTDPGTALSNVVKIVPGTYEIIARADGYGIIRFPRKVSASQVRTIRIGLATNWASTFKLATASGDGDPTTLNNLIDDTEETNWVSPTSPPAGKAVTVDLGGGWHDVRDIQVSALVNGGVAEKFTALRAFDFFTCDATQPASLNCTAFPTGYTKIFTSAPDAFPAKAPWPVTEDLLIRRFNVPDTRATHVRIQVASTQCSGAPDYLDPFPADAVKDHDDDPVNQTDCETGGVGAPGAAVNLFGLPGQARIAELQVFSHLSGAGAPKDPVVALLMTAPLTAKPGGTVEYEISYQNAGPAPSEKAKISDVLPSELQFVSATGGGAYNASTRTVTWNLGTVPVNGAGAVKLKAKVKSGISIGSVIVNQAEFTGELTLSPPTALAATTILP